MSAGDPEIVFARLERLFVARFRAMASPCEVLIDGVSDAQARAMALAVAGEAWRIERTLSRYRTDNLVHRINTANGAPIAVDAELARLLDFADQCHRLSDGRFDITAGALRRVWRFEPGSSVPTRKAVAAVLKSVGWQKVRWQKIRWQPHVDAAGEQPEQASRLLQMPAGMEIDLGGIGKEYAVDRALAQALTLSFEPDGSTAGAVRRGPPACLVNFGGDLRANRPPDGRDAWQIGVEAAGAATGTAASVLALAHGACTTSGDAYRFIERKGRRYGHILDPRTGYPVPGAPRAVTVRGGTCTETGVLSTLAMLEGRDAEAFLAAQGVEHHVQR